MTARVLIVEDEPVLALGLRRFLEATGFEIVACVGSVEKAIAVIDEVECDVAVLDLNLRGESAVPLAVAFRQRDRRLVFMSGYGRSDLPAEFSGVPFLLKPFDPNELAAVIRKMLESRNVA